MKFHVFMEGKCSPFQNRLNQPLLQPNAILKTVLLPFFVLTMVSKAGYSQNKHAVYTTFLEQTVPENGATVTFNSPILRWPHQKGKVVSYDVQLSQDSLFAEEVTIQAAGLGSAMFNPHQYLSAGSWYWRFRVSGKTWSAVNRFAISEKSISMISPPPGIFLKNIPEGHPRLLVYDPAEDLSSLHTMRDAVAIIAEADAAMIHPVLTEADGLPRIRSGDARQQKKIRQDAVVALGNRINNLVVALSQGYLLTGKEQYAKSAILMAVEMAGWDPEGISASSDFTDGVTMYNMALVFDTFYPLLTDGEKSKLLQAITFRADNFFQSWQNNIESKVLSGHVWQLLLNELFKSAIAVYHHDSRAGKWLEYLYELFLARSPVLGGTDGGWAEGAYYLQLNMEMLLEIPDRIRVYTGFDFIQSHPWYHNQANWMIYHFPPGSSNDGFGDNAEDYFSPPASYAAFATELARLTRNEKYMWYVNQLQQSAQYDLATEKMLRWFRLTHAAKQGLPEFSPNIELPLAYRSLETGVAALHTSPGNTSSDVMVAFRSSPFGAYGHILADQNTFNILAGGKRLFYRTGYKVAMDDPHRLGWSKHTKSMNGILADGEGQPYSIESYGLLKRFISGNNLSYVMGDASTAYQSSETNQDLGLKQYFRHILLLNPGIILVYDELQADTVRSWSWLIHALEKIYLDSTSGTFQSQVDNFRGIGRLWGSSPLSWQIADTFEIPAVDFRDYPGKVTKTYNNNQWHVKATSPKTSSIRFLSIIRIDSAGAAIQEIKNSSSENGIVNVQLDDWDIKAVLSVSKSPMLEVRSRSRETFFSAYKKDGKSEMKRNSAPRRPSILIENVRGVRKVTEVSDESSGVVR